MGKTFDKNKMNGFFSDFTQPTEGNTPNTHNKRAWQKRTSITQYINDLIRADMENYFAEGGTKEGWLEDE